MRAAAFWAVLAISVLIAAAASRPPSPRPISAPAEAFSAARAFTTVEAIAQAPHPAGSEEAARVRDKIAARLQALGMKVERHPGTGLAQVRWLAGSVAAAHVDDIVATLPGLDPSLPALALMSHSDTVPNSPGAADNSAGVAASLEIVRAIQAGGRPLRDLMVVVMDAEENGLIGSDAFFVTDPAAKHVGAVINMDMRGSSGRAQMFETGPNARGWTDLFLRTADHPSANALAAVVYQHMPNGTDFTNALHAGVPGLNLSFSGRQFDYHTAHATPGALDLGSLQSLGDQALGAAKAIVDARALPSPTPDGVYFEHPLLSLAGGPLIAYPAPLGWALVGGEALLFAGVSWVALSRGLATWRGSGVGALTLLGMTLAAGLGLQLLSVPFGSGYADIQQRYAVLGRYSYALAAAGLIAFALALGTLRFARRWARTWSLWLGALTMMLALAVAIQADEPAAGFVVAWPLLFGLVGAAAALALGGALDRAGPVAAISLSAVLGASLVFALGGMVFSAVGVDMPAAFAVVVPLAAATLIPLGAEAGGWALFATPAGVLVLGLAALAGAGAERRGSPGTPALTEAFFIADPAHGFYERADALDRLDDWARAALTADGGSVGRRAEPPFFAEPIFAAPSKPFQSDPARVEAERFGGRVVLRILPGTDARELRLRLRISAPARDITLEGRPAHALERAAVWQRLSFAAPPRAGVTLAFTPAPGSRLEVAAMKIVDGPPPGSRLPPRPRSVQPFGFSDATLILSSATFAW